VEDRVTGKPSNRDRTALLRQQLAASAGGKGRPVPTHDGMVPSIKVDRDRITLPGLRFMGEEPHPSQLFKRGGDE